MSKDAREIGTISNSRDEVGMHKHGFYYSITHNTRRGYNLIMVIVDMLTKGAHIIPIKMTYTTLDIARVFIKEIFRIHRLPKRIVSDRDANFTLKFWTSLFQAVGTQTNSISVWLIIPRLMAKLKG